MTTIKKKNFSNEQAHFKRKITEPPLANGKKNIQKGKFCPSKTQKRGPFRGSDYCAKAGGGGDYHDPGGEIVRALKLNKYSRVGKKKGLRWKKTKKKK